MTDKQRANIAASCTDCDHLPKAEGAGSVVEENGVEFQLMHNGIRTRTDSHYGSYNVEVIQRLKGHHEPQEELAFDEVLKRVSPGGVILELGSFWAYYSLWFLHSVPDSKAILVEPVPEGLEAGRRNFELNNREGTFIHAALSDTPQPSKDIELWPGKITNAPTKTVDSILKDQSLDSIAILHADIQGHELKMLKGAAKTLASKKAEWVFISTHHENIHQACIKELKRHGYSIAVSHSLGESYSVDGLIVASANSGSLQCEITKRKSWAISKAKLRSWVRIHIMEPLKLRPPTA